MHRPAHILIHTSMVWLAGQKDLAKQTGAYTYMNDLTKYKEKIDKYHPCKIKNKDFIIKLRVHVFYIQTSIFHRYIYIDIMCADSIDVILCVYAKSCTYIIRSYMDDHEMVPSNTLTKRPSGQPQHQSNRTWPSQASVWQLWLKSAWGPCAHWEKGDHQLVPVYELTFLILDKNTNVIITGYMYMNIQRYTGTRVLL